MRSDAPRFRQPLCRSLDERQWVGHRARRGHTVARDLDPLEGEDLVAPPERSRDRRDRHVRTMSRVDHRAGQLAEPALPIDPPFAGDHEIRADDPLRETHRAEHELGPRHEPRVKERQQSRAETAGRASAGHVPDRTADESLDDIGVSAERGVELMDDFWARAFLRAIDRRCALRPEQRVTHVARHIDAHADEPRIGLAIDAREMGERGASLGKVAAFAVEEPIAEGARHSGAAVIGRAAADSDNEPVRAACRCREDQLSRPERGGDARIPLIRAQQRQPARGSHLDHSCGAVAEQPPLGVDFAQQWIVDSRGAKRAFCRADQRMHSPFAAVGERDLFDVRVGPRAPDAASDRGRDGDRVGRTFERLGSNDDPRRGHTGMICILRDILTASDPVAIARDPESLARSWSELARRRAHPTVFLTPEWLAVARAHDPREQLTLEIGTQGIAALARDKDGTISFGGGELTDEQDVVARASDVPVVAEALAAWIADQRIGRTVFSYVPEEVPTAETLRTCLTASGYDANVERLVTSPRLDLPADFPAYLQSLTKKERHELRRKMRRLESGREVRFRFADQSERSEVLDRFVALHRRSRGEKADFMTAENERLFRDVADALASRGWLRLGVLDVDGAVAAVLFGWKYEGTMALYNAAYDPDLASLSVGIVSHAYAIRDAIGEGARAYDLLRGGEPYKYDLGADDHWLVRLVAERR